MPPKRNTSRGRGCVQGAQGRSTSRGRHNADGPPSQLPARLAAHVNNQQLGGNPAAFPAQHIAQNDLQEEAPAPEPANANILQQGALVPAPANANILQPGNYNFEPAEPADIPIHEAFMQEMNIIRQNSHMVTQLTNLGQETTQNTLYLLDEMSVRGHSKFVLISLFS